ncbi:hypothetical protein ACFV6E_40050 [Streptomyces sp. NPDC059785]
MKVQFSADFMLGTHRGRRSAMTRNHATGLRPRINKIVVKKAA